MKPSILRANSKGPNPGGWDAKITSDLRNGFAGNHLNLPNYYRGIEFIADTVTIICLAYGVMRMAYTCSKPLTAAKGEDNKSNVRLLVPVRMHAISRKTRHRIL